MSRDEDPPIIGKLLKRLGRHYLEWWLWCHDSDHGEEEWEAMRRRYLALDGCSERWSKLCSQRISEIY